MSNTGQEKDNIVGNNVYTHNINQIYILYIGCSSRGHFCNLIRAVILVEIYN